jgi:hypothetical protein
MYCKAIGSADPNNMLLFRVALPIEEEEAPTRSAHCFHQNIISKKPAPCMEQKAAACLEI